jgi:hypothetical protein
MSTAFAVTWDYRCPFARNAHEYVVAGLEAGADWDVSFLPFCLTQTHVEEGELDVWDDPGRTGDLLALASGVVVRDHYPAAFPRVHLALFAARHDQGQDLREEEVVRAVLAGEGLDPGPVLAEVAQGWPGDAVRKAHEAAVADHQVFGVPTFIAGDRAVFVRLMTRPLGDADAARATIDHVVSLLVGHPELNEFKHTAIGR